VLIVDDMVDTGTTLKALSNRLRSEGAKNIYICASHGKLDIFELFVLYSNFESRKT